MDPAAWIEIGTAVVDPAAAGWLEAGEARAMGGDGSFTQSTCVDTPPPGMGLAFQVGVAADGGGAMQSGWVRALLGPAPRARRTGSFGAEFMPWTVCVGEAAPGAAIDLSLSVTGLAALESVRLDSLTIAPVPEALCPPPGTVRNGDFAETVGWSNEFYFETDPGGNQLIHLRTSGTPPYCCNCGNVIGLASVPTASALPSAALSFQVRGSLAVGGQFTVDTSPDGESQVRLGTFDTVPATWQAQLVCLPADHAGRVIDVNFGIIQIPAPPCPAALDVFIDDVQIVSAPALCP
jgi:hypothetical protein